MIRTPNIPLDTNEGMFETQIPINALNAIKSNITVKLSAAQNQFDVRISRVLQQGCEGIIVSHPDNDTLHGLKYGHLIRFQKNNIFKIISQ